MRVVLHARFIDLAQDLRDRRAWVSTQCQRQRSRQDTHHLLGGGAGSICELDPKHDVLAIVEPGECHIGECYDGARGSGAHRLRRMLQPREVGTRQSKGYACMTTRTRTLRTLSICRQQRLRQMSEAREPIVTVASVILRLLVATLLVHHLA